MTPSLIQPIFLRHLFLTSLLMALLLLTPRLVPAKTDIISREYVYYVRLDIKYTDGALEQGKLLMVPAGSEFRAAQFNIHEADGTSTSDQRDMGQAKSRALHNAIENLLLRYGLKSVSSKETLINYSARTEIVMSYEGIVKTPITFLKEGYLPDKKEYRVEIRIQFSPIAFPDKWERLLRKKKWNDFLSDIKNFFKG